MKRLLLTRQFPAAVAEAAAERFDVVQRDADTAMTADEAAAALRDYDAILCSIGDQFTAEAFAGDDLRCGVIGNFGVGFNHIDIDAAQAAGVRVSNTPDVVTDATADIAMTLILMIAKTLLF